MNNVKNYKMKYLKYKMKYLELKKNQIGGIINGCRDMGFNNNFGTCWNITIQMIMFFGDKTKNDVQNLIEKLNNKTQTAKNIVEISSKKLSKFLPKNLLDDKENLLENTQFHIERMIIFIQEKLNNYKILLENDDIELTENIKFKSELICEYGFVATFYELFNLKSNDGEFGGEEHELFFLINIFSILFCNKYIKFDTILIDNEKQININDALNSVGILMSTFEHSIAYYKCNDTERFIDNNFSKKCQWINILKQINKNKSENKKQYLTNNINNCPSLEDNKNKNNNINKLIVADFCDDYNFSIIYLLVYYYINEDLNNFNNLIIKHKHYVNYNYNGHSLLKYFIMKKNNSIYNFIKILLDNGANINGLGTELFNPLEFAVIKNNIDLIIFLLKNGANINLVGIEGFTPLSYAIENNNYEIIELLIKYGANVNVINILNNEEYELMSSIKNDNLKLTKLLIENGANVNLFNNKGYSPLIYAIIKNATETIKLLIKNGADVNLFNDKGYNSLSFAIINKNNELKKLLIENGGYIDLLDEYGISKHLKY
jgi:ankyrin repeat protein